ncbi:acyl-CoA dehydrogenase family protein [Pseudomonas nitroreducens]|uniref:Acyl-CoA dehydrogenase n=1 Tax=Pseudomonas nitroreducens TaxID=46680 RepID=A0A6G6J5R9_PSENT|nr:acyl-CoA dehydrogenase family protein [Pseudomonas nitroreducens]QIE89821.1 acyl-CoA dehydrogenase [Pseudomonas nitroreducens]
MTAAFNFKPLAIPAALEPLRQEVRGFLTEASRHWSGWKVGHSWTGFDREFSREVGARGWIGMTWPMAYGGHERSGLERYVVVEEMLAVGAPLGAHWFGDRQSGPLLLRLGSPAQRERFLPLIARGEASFCIGLSEPDSGSDLASLRSRASRVEGGWRLSGRKVWTTNAHLCDFMIGLFRTTAQADGEKHKGLSQFLIDMRSSGIEVRPIHDLTGEAHFNEVTFDDVFVADDMLVGREGDGWAQASAELAFERSQPDRYMSCYPLLPLTVDALRASQATDRLTTRRIGEVVAEMTVLREMSLSILGQLQDGHSPAREAALVKDLGNLLEQRTPELVRELLDLPATIQANDRLSELQGFLVQTVPTFSLRGGTREILRGIIAKGLGLK